MSSFKLYAYIIHILTHLFPPQETTNCAWYEYNTINDENSNSCIYSFVPSRRKYWYDLLITPIYYDLSTRYLILVSNPIA